MLFWFILITFLIVVIQREVAKFMDDPILYTLYFDFQVHMIKYSMDQLKMKLRVS